MHKVMVVANEKEIAQLNTLLDTEAWWVAHIASAQNGSWMVVLTDIDPDHEGEDDDEEEDDDYIDSMVDDMELEEEYEETH